MSIVLVTGARGLLGSTICDYLRFHPDINLVLAHHNEKLPDVKPDIIIHCAAISKQAYDPKDPSGVFRANIGFTQEIIETYGDIEKPPIFIFPSSIAVYGSDKYYKQESNQCCPLNLYSISKLACEDIIKFYHRMGRIGGVIFRLGALVGKRSSGPIFEITQKILSDVNNVELFGLTPIGTTKNYTKVIDVASFIADLAQNQKMIEYLYYRDEAALYNLCSNRAFSIQEIFNIISKELRISKYSYFNDKSYPGDSLFLLANSNLAKSELNWNPSDEGIIKYGVECALSLLGQEKRTLVGTSEKF